MGVLKEKSWKELGVDLEEDESYANYLLKKGRELPDMWQPRAQRYPSEAVRVIYFKEELSGLKDYIKAYAYQLFFLTKNDPATVYTKVSSITQFFREKMSGEFGIEINFRKAFVESIVKHKEDVREHIIQEKVSNKIKLLFAKSLDVHNFLLFLDLFSGANQWASSFDLYKELPKKAAAYFSRRELELYRLELNRQIGRHNTPSLDWNTTCAVVEFLDEYKGFNYGGSAVVIALEAGLRISEIRALRRDCLVSVTEDEQAMVARHLARLKRSPIKLDYSESAWLRYHIIKGKGGELVEGTPILVGKRVINAINEVLEATVELADESGSEMLFLNRSATKRKQITVRSYTALNKDLRELFEMGMPPLRFHQCRATFATILYRLGIPIGVIEKYLNHISSDVTAGYTHGKEQEASDKLSWLIQNELDENVDERLKTLREELMRLIGSNEFIGLSHSSRIALFDRLVERHGVKLKMSDHGVCVLPEGVNCPEGFESVLPCHASECSKFYPNNDSESFFVALLENNKERIAELEELVVANNTIEVNFDLLRIETSSLESILERIRKVV